MKRILLAFLYLSILLLTSCDNPRSVRHVIRAIVRAEQVGKNISQEPSKDNLISLRKETDAAGRIVFTAYYTMPADTSMFFLNLSYNMPEKLGFEGQMDSCTVNAYFFRSASDTGLTGMVLKRSFFFQKNDNFYNISTIPSMPVSNYETRR